MRIARIAALVFTAVCLVVAAVSLLGPTTMTFCEGSDCSTLECGSPAYPTALNDPKALIDFDRSRDAPITGAEVTAAAANCAGQTSASTGLYGVILACAGLGAVALTSRRGTNERQGTPASVDSSA